MDIDRLLVFAAAYFAVVILPGPAVTALIARVLARGPGGAAGLVAGVAVGAVIWLTVAAAGLAALAAAFAPLFVVIRYAGAAYLLWLAWKLWTAPVQQLDESRTTGEDKSLLLTGLAINLGNPKAIVFFLALLPSVVDLDRLTPLASASSPPSSSPSCAACSAPTRCWRSGRAGCSRRRALSASSIAAAASLWQVRRQPSRRVERQAA